MDAPSGHESRPVGAGAARDGQPSPRTGRYDAQNFTFGGCWTALRSPSSRLKKSCGPKPSMLANRTAGKLSRRLLYSEAALLKKRRAAAILFSMSESSVWSCWKLVLALRSG